MQREDVCVAHFVVVREFLNFHIESKCSGITKLASHYANSFSGTGGEVSQHGYTSMCRAAQFACCVF